MPIISSRNCVRYANSRRHQSDTLAAVMQTKKAPDAGGASIAILEGRSVNDASRIEQVVEAQLEDVLVGTHVLNERSRCPPRDLERCEIDVFGRETQIVIFKLHGPIVGEGIFKTETETVRCAVRGLRHLTGPSNRPGPADRAGKQPAQRIITQPRPGERGEGRAWGQQSSAPAPAASTRPDVDLTMSLTFM
jgi:hypothetical protein